MLDLFTIFSKGGIVLWYFQGTSESFTTSVNALIKSVILQVCMKTENRSNMLCQSSAWGKCVVCWKTRGVGSVGLKGFWPHEGLPSDYPSNNLVKWEKRLKDELALAPFIHLEEGFKPTGGHSTQAQNRKCHVRSITEISSSQS